MTYEEAKENQDRIARDYNLGWWYGLHCEKCCEVYPKLSTEGNLAGGDCFYECEVCGKRVRGFAMPWLARDAWNRGEFLTGQLKMF